MTDKQFDLEAQVAVIGGGGAGLAAAVTVAEKGMDVLLIEKHRKPGGNSAMAAGFFGIESPVQKRKNYNVLKDEFFTLHMKYSHWTVNPRLFRAYIDKSGDTVAWLEEMGIDFDLLPHWPNLSHLTWHCPKGRGPELINVLTKRLEELGGHLLGDTEVKEIIIEGNNIKGVLARNAKKEEVRIKASVVILATGGYGGNRRLLKKYYPYYNENLQLAGFPNMGDGLSMALQAGAATEGLGVLHLSKTWRFAHQPKIVVVVALQPNTVFVNNRGERFMDEAAIYNHYEGLNPVVRQPQGLAYTILDSALIKNFASSGFVDGFGPMFPIEGDMADLPRLLEAEVAKGKVKISDSIDEIANWIGANPETLKYTLSEYNSFCAKGHDSLFSKDSNYLVPLNTPPYYATKCGVRFLGTIGGIKINHNMEVIDKKDNPIPGLYATGIDAGGWQPETYNILLPGTTLGFAINSGRIAAENAVRYIKNNN